MPGAVIELPVDEATARAFDAAPPEARRFWTDAIISWARTSNGHGRTMADVADDASAEAAANGLTQEILDEILRG